MKNKETIQLYINNFRRRLAPYMRPGIGLACTVYPASSQGAILEFKIGQGISNADEFKPESETVNEALAGIRQRAFGGNLHAFKFGGTNVIMEDDRIVLVKGEDGSSEWDEDAAGADVKRILPPAIGGGQ